MVNVGDTGARVEVVEALAQGTAAMVRTLMRFSVRAQRVLDAWPSGRSATFGVKSVPDGAQTGVRLPAVLAVAAGHADLLVRFQVVVDGYEPRHVQFAAIRGVREADLRLRRLPSSRRCGVTGSSITTRRPLIGRCGLAII